MRQRITDELRRFYNDNRIAVRGFNCPYRQACEADAKRPLIHGMEAHVGHKYGEVTRIVVVSLDSGGDSDNLNDRTSVIEALQETTANPHMRGTFHFLSAMLDQEIRQQSPMPFFAMLNSAKCSGADGSADTVPWQLHYRCRSYLIRELAILEPQIIWLQGRTVRNVFASEGKLSSVPNFDQRVANWLEEKHIDDSEIRDLVCRVGREHLFCFSNADKPYVTVASAHPSDRYGRWHAFERTTMGIIAKTAVALTRIVA